jgi:DNA-binding transcriptional LysR family regulator
VAPGRVDTDEFAFVRRMVLAGFGIALAPLTLFRALVDSGEVERVLPRFARRSARVRVVWRAAGSSPRRWRCSAPLLTLHSSLC